MFVVDGDRVGNQKFEFMAECGFHPSLAGEACGFCIVEGFGLGGERESLELLLRLLCSPYQHASHQELRMVLVAYVGPFCLELLCFQTDLLPVLTEICLVCLQIAQRDEGVLNVWRESCVQCLLRPLRLHEDKLPLLQLAVHALVDATRALELMLLSANEASCCAFVWQEMLELVLNEPEVGRHVLLLQAPPHVFSQGVRQRNADCSACFQLLVGELTGTEEVCREPDFAQFLCASVCPQVLVANTLVVLLLGSTTTTLGGDLECLVERMIGELQRAEAEAALALEALLHQQAVPTACAVALAHAITHMEHAEHRQRMYKALATSPSLLLDAVISEWSQGSVVLEADALALLLLSLGSEQRDLEALYQFVGAGGCQTQPVLSLVCEIARVKILAAPALFSLGLALVEGLGQQANAEYHELLCCLLERERDATVTSFAIALQQTGYLAVMLRNISALNLSRVKHLLQLVLGLIDFPFFLSLDHVNFALGADISRHAVRLHTLLPY